MSNKYCLVKNCRFPMSHITQGHKCICGDYGHGQLECGNKTLINILTNTVYATNLELPKNLHCDIFGCKTQHTHTRESHVCEKCGEREKCSYNCEKNHVSALPIIGEIFNNPQCLFNIGFNGINNYEEQIEKAKQIFATKTGKIFFCSYAGMGCHLFVKRNDINSNIEIFFMHHDSWGQYGYIDIPKLNAFINGYEFLKNTCI